MRKIRESTLESYFNRQANLRGLVSLKFTSPGFRGVPDRIVIGPVNAPIGRGLTWYVELKTTGETLRPRQEYVRKIFEVHGCAVNILDAKEKVDNFFKLVEDEIRSARLYDLG